MRKPAYVPFVALFFVFVACGDRAEDDPAAIEFAAPPSPGNAEEVAAAASAYPLTIDAVERFAQAHESLRSIGESVPTETTAWREESAPEPVRLAVEDAGLTVDEFLVINTTLLPAYFVARMREAGLPEAERPGDVRESHVTFVERYKEEIEALLALEEL